MSCSSVTVKPLSYFLVNSVSVITLIGKRQARVGNEFVYMGRTDKCIECPLRKVCCDKLEPDRAYTVISVREREHDCPIHEDGVQLVEVEESGARITLPTHQLFEGAVFTVHVRPCDKWECEYHAACNPTGIKDGDRCRVEKVYKRAGLTCPRRRKLGLADVNRVS